MSYKQQSALCRMIDRQMDGFLLIGWSLRLKNLLMQMINLFLSEELIIKEENRDWDVNFQLTCSSRSSWWTLPVLLQQFVSILTLHCALPPPKPSGASLMFLTSKAEAVYPEKHPVGFLWNQIPQIPWSECFSQPKGGEDLPAWLGKLLSTSLQLGQHHAGRWWGRRIQQQWFVWG